MFNKNRPEKEKTTSLESVIRRKHQPFCFNDSAQHALTLPDILPMIAHRRIARDCTSCAGEASR
jgi:hypothetical protein